MTRRWVICGLLTVLPAAAVAENWVEIQSPHFTVLSDAGEKRAREVAGELEQIRLVFRAALPNASLDPALPVRVFAVRNENGLKELLPQFWEGDGPRPGGAFFKVPDHYVIVLRTDARGSSRFQPIYHEYFHLLTSLNLQNVPIWLNEGLAEFWSQTVVRKNQVELGNTNKTHLQTLRQTMLPLRDLVVATGNPHEADPRHVTVFYAESWALTHLLLMRDPNLSGRKQLAAYLNGIQQGVDPLVAFESAFGQVEEVERELQQYVRRPILSAMRMEASASVEPGTFSVSELSDSESLAARGRLLAFGARPDTAVPLLEKALSLDPESTVAKEGLGYYHFRRGDLDEAKAWLDRAMESGRASFLSFYFLAQIEKTAGDVRAPAVEEALRRVIALEPDFAPALSELASHLAARQEKLEEALTLATRATELEPESAWTWVNLGVVYLVVGHSDEARNAGLRAEAVATTSPEREAVEELRKMLADFEETVARETVRGRFTELRCREDGKLDFIVTKPPNEIYVLRVENVNLVELWRNGSPAHADLECGAQEGEVRATFVVLDRDGTNVLGDLKRLELEPGP